MFSRVTKKRIGVAASSVVLMVLVATAAWAASAGAVVFANNDAVVGGATRSYWNENFVVSGLAVGETVTDVKLWVLEGTTWVEYNGTGGYPDTTPTINPKVNNFQNCWGSTTDLHHHKPGLTWVFARAYLSTGGSVDTPAQQTGCP